MKEGIIVLFVMLLLGCTAERQVLPELTTEKMSILEISKYREQKQLVQNRFLLKTNQELEFITCKIQYSSCDIGDCGCCSMAEIVFISKIPVNNLITKGTHSITKERLYNFLKSLSQRMPSDLDSVYSFVLLSTIELKETKLQQKVLTFEEFNNMNENQKIDGAIYLCGRSSKSTKAKF